MATNNHIAQLKSRLDQAIIQRDHWKQMAARKNMLVIVDVDPESRSTIEYIVTEDHVRAMWKRMESLASQRDKLAGLLREKFPRIDPEKPYPMDEVEHHCEYTLYQERERLHREIDAALAEVKP